MPSIEELREKARAHAKQLDAVHWAKTSELKARWGIDEEIILAIPRADLPYLEFGDSNARRYDPCDVEAYERTHKGAAAA
jgi:hypothetical protein